MLSKTLLCASLGALLAPGAADREAPDARACKVYCFGPLLGAVQQAGLYPDSKTFVDRPLLSDPEDVLDAFQKLRQPADTSTLRNFVDTHFGKEGSELRDWVPPDWVEAPGSLASLGNETKRTWALELNHLWKTLAREQDPDVLRNPQRYSLLPRRHGFVVPGGRFRETYYWDTYWIVRGLIDSGMFDTARGVVDNLVEDVKSFGFIPNGGRVYYLDRSQPPMLTSMVMAVQEVSPNMEWLAAVLPWLEREYDYWMDFKRGHVTYIRLGHKAAVLNRYNSLISLPRAESYSEDVKTAAEAKEIGASAEDVFRGLRAGAESGWDYSSRWLASAGGGAATMKTIQAQEVVPADLNSIMYEVEVDLADLNRRLNNYAAAQKYETAAKARKKSMDMIMWDSGCGCYRDYFHPTGERSKVVSLGSFAVPWWAGLYGPADKAKDCPGNSCGVSGLLTSGLVQIGGVLTTTIESGQQWDSPNAWAPLQLMLIEGLDRMGDTVGAKATADGIATSFLDNCLLTWKNTGYMSEKYNALKPGTGGGGGEYEPQVGFGWTNGVVLSLLLREDRQFPSQTGGP